MTAASATILPEAASSSTAAGSWPYPGAAAAGYPPPAAGAGTFLSLLGALLGSGLPAAPPDSDAGIAAGAGNPPQRQPESACPGCGVEAPGSAQAPASVQGKGKDQAAAAAAQPPLPGPAALELRPGGLAPVSAVRPEQPVPLCGLPAGIERPVAEGNRAVSGVPAAAGAASPNLPQAASRLQDAGRRPAPRSGTDSRPAVPLAAAAEGVPAPWQAPAGPPVPAAVAGALNPLPRPRAASLDSAAPAAPGRDQDNPGEEAMEPTPRLAGQPAPERGGGFRADAEPEAASAAPASAPGPLPALPPEASAPAGGAGMGALPGDAGGGPAQAAPLPAARGERLPVVRSGFPAASGAALSRVLADSGGLPAGAGAMPAPESRAARWTAPVPQPGSAPGASGASQSAAPRPSGGRGSVGSGVSLHGLEAAAVPEARAAWGELAFAGRLSETGPPEFEAAGAGTRGSFAPPRPAAVRPASEAAAPPEPQGGDRAGSIPGDEAVQEREVAGRRPEPSPARRPHQAVPEPGAGSRSRPEGPGEPETPVNPGARQAGSPVRPLVQPAAVAADPLPVEAGEDRGAGRAAPPAAPAARTLPPPGDRPAPPRTDGISLRLSGPGEPAVGIRLRERGGEVEVAVHSPDARLSESLRSELGELAGRLEQAGYRSELWTPGAGRDAAERETRPPAAGESAPGREGGGADHPPGGDGRRGQRQPRTRWIEVYETGQAAGGPAGEGEDTHAN